MNLRSGIRIAIHLSTGPCHLPHFIKSLLCCSTLSFLPLGCGAQDGSETIGPPTGKTGNEWTQEDFAHLDSTLATEGSAEFIAFCQKAGTCELKGEVFEQFKEILKKYPVESDEEYDYFAVVVRDELMEIGLIPPGDPGRYQYRITSLVIALDGQ